MTPGQKKIVAVVLLAIGAALIVRSMLVGSGIERGIPNTARRDIATKLAELPPAVQGTIAREGKGGTLHDIDTEGDAGERTYKVEIIIAGTKQTIEIAPDGAVRARKSRPYKQ